PHYTLSLHDALPIWAVNTVESTMERRNSGTVVEERTSRATFSVALAPAAIEAGEAKARSMTLPEASSTVLVKSVFPPSVTTTRPRTLDGTMGALFPSSIRILSPKSRTVEDCAPPGFVKTSDVAATPVWPRFTDAGRDE